METHGKLRKLRKQQQQQKQQQLPFKCKHCGKAYKRIHAEVTSEIQSEQYSMKFSEAGSSVNQFKIELTSDNGSNHSQATMDRIAVKRRIRKTKW